VIDPVDFGRYLAKAYAWSGSGGQACEGKSSDPPPSRIPSPQAAVLFVMKPAARSCTVLALALPPDCVGERIQSVADQSEYLLTPTCSSTPTRTLPLLPCDRCAGFPSATCPLLQRRQIIHRQPQHHFEL
jgi:hypothetical protein